MKICQQVIRIFMTRQRNNVYNEPSASLYTNRKVRDTFYNVISLTIRNYSFSGERTVQSICYEEILYTVVFQHNQEQNRTHFSLN